MSLSLQPHLSSSLSARLCDAVSPGVPVRLKGDVAVIGDEEQPGLSAINNRIQDSQVMSAPIAKCDTSART